MIYGGAGRHAVAVSYEEFITFTKLFVATDYLYMLTTTFPKLCILALYLRVFTAKYLRITCYAIGVIMIVTVIAAIIDTSAICRPLAYFWDKTIPGGECGDLLTAQRGFTIPNVITDVIMLLLPLPSVWGLHTSQNQKVGLTFVFLTGSM